MSTIEILLAVAGFIVTALVVAGMILLTPRGTRVDDEIPQHADLNGAAVPGAVPTPREAVR
jgi:hypothetical protein